MKQILRLMTTAMALFALASAGAQMPVPSAPTLSARSHVLVDHASGQTLAAHNENEPMEPASLTKLMTAYVVFRSLKDGRISLQDEVPVSEKAWRTPGSRMFIEVDTRVPVELLLQGMIVQSGNDASVALAEYVAGSEATFAELMNQYARELGMLNSRFLNATGLPADGHLTTAADIARLARAIISEFPDFYHWYSQREFTYNGITQKNRNALLWRDPSVDGMKTGMTDSAGYCLVTSAQRDNMRLISVVLGTKSATARANDSQALLNYGFRFFETRLLYPAGGKVTEARVWKGQTEQASLGVRNDLYVTIPRGSYDQIRTRLELPEPLIAPVGTDARIGQLNVDLGGQTLAQTDLFALAGVDTGSLWRQAWDSVLLWFQ